MSDAKAELGVWTNAGVSEGRELFWRSYGQGKVFAQRQSFYDIIFSLLSNRDSDAFGRQAYAILVYP